MPTRPTSHYDVIIAGLGAMGSATAAQLARRGQRVLGLDRWSPGHANGSSHGDSRIIREMYFEHPMYVPLLQRAYELWTELTDLTGEPVLHMTGGLMIGPPDGKLITGVLRSAKEHGLPYELFSPAEVSERFPAFSLRDDLVAVRDPRAGYLNPETCNAAHLRVARESGAELRFEEPLVAWQAVDGGVTVATSAGTYQAERLLLAAGARTGAFMNGWRLPLAVERQPVFWFEPHDSADSYVDPRFPIWAYEYAPREVCYGFPKLPRGVKASIMHSGEIVDDADNVRRSVGDDEVEPLRRALGGILPALAKGRIVERDVCLFTNTPDRDFIIDFHPEHPQVLVSSACSGHGFKFASVIGEIQADLIMRGKSAFDLSPFSIRRAALDHPDR